MSSDHLEQTSAYLDGELDQAAAAEAESHVASCAECQAFVLAASEVSERLRGPAARMASPPGLDARIRRVLGEDAASKVVSWPQPPLRTRFWTGAAAGVGASAIAAVMALTIGPMMNAETLSVALADDHVDALMQGRAITVASSSHHTVKPWFAGRAPISPTVVDFADQGFPLAGGRVDLVKGRKAAVVVYRHGAHEIDLYAWIKDGDTLASRSERRGYHLISWTEGDIAYLAISDVQPGELDHFVQLVRAARE